MKSYNFLVTGVGGQGTVVASDIIAAVGLAAGYDVKKSDVLGLAVRGGSVVSHIRWGEQVRSPIVPEGQVDVLIAFEEVDPAVVLAVDHGVEVLLELNWQVGPVAAFTGVYVQSHGLIGPVER